MSQKSAPNSIFDADETAFYDKTNAQLEGVKNPCQYVSLAAALLVAGRPAPDVRELRRQYHGGKGRPDPRDWLETAANVSVPYARRHGLGIVVFDVAAGTYGWSLRSPAAVAAARREGRLLFLDSWDGHVNATPRRLVAARWAGFCRQTGAAKS